MAVVGIFAVYLTGSRRQQVLQGPKTVLNPTATLPCPDEPRGTDGRFETHHVELLCTGLRNNDEDHRSIRRTGGPKPCIVQPRHLRAVTPGPIALMLQVTPLDLAPVWQLEDIRTFPFHEEGSLMGGGHMAHELRITKPTIRDDHRRRQYQAASAQSRHASIQHHLHPAQFVAARPSRARGIRTTDSKVYGDHQFAIANNHDAQNAINTGEYPVFLGTPPSTHEPQ